MSNSAVSLLGNPEQSFVAKLNKFFDERQVEPGLRDELLALGTEEHALLCVLIEILRPSANTLREIVKLIKEICTRDALTWGQLISEDVFKQVLKAENSMGAKDRIKQLKKALDVRRFPETQKIENRLEILRKNLIKQFGLPLQFPKDLEGDTLSLSIEFSSMKDLESLADAMNKLSKDQKLEEIFSLLRGQW